MGITYSSFRNILDLDSLNCLETCVAKCRPSSRRQVGELATFVFAGGDAFEVHNAEVQPLLEPDAVHDADHLKSQHVLPQVLTNLTQTN